MIKLRISSRDLMFWSLISKITKIYPQMHLMSQLSCLHSINKRYKNLKCLIKFQKRNFLICKMTKLIDLNLWGTQSQTNNNCHLNKAIHYCFLKFKTKHRIFSFNNMIIISVKYSNQNQIQLVTISNQNKLKVEY